MRCGRADTPRSAVELADRGCGHALGAESDGRQRVLDLVRDAARHFVPGRRLLRAQQFAGVFEDTHETRGSFSSSAETVTAS